MNGKSFILVNEKHSAALVAENINNDTRLKAVPYNSSDDSITKWYFTRVSNNDYWFYISDGNGNYLNIGDNNNSYVKVSSQPQQIYIDRSYDLFRLQRGKNGYTTYSTAVNLYGGNISGGFGPYNDNGENEWFRAYYPSNNAKIHYVDEQGNELTVSNGSISSSTLLKDHAYLIYDIEGGEYEYKEAYINSENTKVKAYLKRNGTNWQYTTDGSSWSNVKDKDDIYIVYKKKTTPTEGGTPTLVELDEDEKPDSPTVTKGSTVNGDGTNTLSLSVTSHTKPREVLKLADVIVIFDQSGSMKEKFGSSTRLQSLKDAVNTLAKELIGDSSEYIYTDKDGKKHKQIEMSLISFSTVSTNATSFTDDEGTFKKWVNALKADGGTNWEQALQKANETSVDSGRATFVIFVTDGEPTFRMSRMTDTDDKLSDDLYFGNYYSTVGEYYRDNNVYGKGDSDNYNSYNYKDATIVDGTVTPDGNDLLNPAGKFDPVDPLELTTRPLKVKKQWHNNYVDSRELTDRITMELYGVDSDGTTSHTFKTIELTREGGWSADNNYISYGLVTYDTSTNSGEKVYETGHDFTLRETDEEAHYYELTAGVFRPMFINGTPTILEKVDADDAVFLWGSFLWRDGAV